MAKRKQKTANTQRWRGFRAPSTPTQLLAEVQTGMVWPPWTSTWQRPQKLTCDCTLGVCAAKRVQERDDKTLSTTQSKTEQGK